MKAKFTKEQVKEKITRFFQSKHLAKQVKKMKKLAMRHQIKLGKYRKKFCKKCYSMNLQTQSIKNKLKRVKCGDCEYVARWKIK